MRGKPEKFADHYTQATLFWNSQSAGREGAHRRRVPLRADQGAGACRCASAWSRAAQRRGRARASAWPTGSGSRCRSRCRRCSTRAPSPRSRSSPALSLLARPGDGGIETRRIAILVADGVDGDAAAAPARARSRSRRGAALRRRDARHGRESAGGEPIEVEVSIEPARRCCSTRVVLPDGERRRQDARATRAGDRVRQGPVPALQADPRARRGRARCSRRPACSRRCRTASPIPACCTSRTAARARRSRRSSRRSRKHRHFERETLPPRV